MSSTRFSLACMLAITLTLSSSSSVSAFVIPMTQRHYQIRTPTTLFIDKRIADMIDQEFYREQHIQDFEREWMQENKKVLTYHMHGEQEVIISKYNGDEEENFRSKAKDRIMAQQHPQMYCMDRCLATGNCDVFEEMFRFSPYEVMDFCKECVLSEDELCDVPEAFYAENNGKDTSKLKP